MNNKSFVVFAEGQVHQVGLTTYDKDCIARIDTHLITSTFGSNFLVVVAESELYEDTPEQLKLRLLRVHNISRSFHRGIKNVTWLDLNWEWLLTGSFSVVIATYVAGILLLF